MTAAQDLAADPEAFMRENIVIVEMQGDTSGAVVNGTTQLKLYNRPRTHVQGHKRNFRKTRVGVYFLHPGAANVYYPDATVDPNQITAYFCPYNANSTLGANISNQANVMFTTQMDGCTFGVGSVAPDGSRLVYHTNQATQGDPNNPWAQANAQDQALRTAFNSSNRMISAVLGPGDYRVSRGGTYYKATTFGKRDPVGNTWQFFSMRYTVERTGPPTVFGWKELLRVH